MLGSLLGYRVPLVQRSHKCSTNGTHDKLSTHQEYRCHQLISNKLSCSMAKPRRKSDKVMARFKILRFGVVALMEMRATVSTVFPWPHFQQLLLKLLNPPATRLRHRAKPPTNSNVHPAVARFFFFPCSIV